MSKIEPKVPSQKTVRPSTRTDALKPNPTALASGALALLVAGLALAVSQWGVMALSLTALVLVPVVMVALILITVGK